MRSYLLHQPGDYPIKKTPVFCRCSQNDVAIFLCTRGGNAQAHAAHQGGGSDAVYAWLIKADCLESRRSRI